MVPKLSLEDHIKKLNSKSKSKTERISKICPYVGLEKMTTVNKAFVISQFGCIPLVWIFQSSCLDNKMYFLHERTLGITYGDESLSFQDILKNDNSISIYCKNI